MKNSGTKNWFKLLILAFSVIFILGQGRYSKNTNSQEPKNDLPIVQINMLSFDDVNAVLTSKLQLFFSPKLVNESGIVQDEYNFIDVLNFNESILTIKGNKRYAAFDNGLSSNYQLDSTLNHFYYPFDSYKINLIYFLDKTNSKGVIERVPFKNNCDFCSIRGYQINTKDIFDKNRNILTLETHIMRPISTKIIVIINIIVMWVLSLVILFMTISIAKSKIKPDIGTFGFIAGLLFALPLIRNISPMIPYMGVFIDFIGFFLNEFTVACCMVASAYCWILRKDSASH
ncbi:DUF4436 family protein [Fluviispira multicolorata]|nr:DUF4436 family protein [Fluviispira multicolorata]